MERRPHGGTARDARPEPGSPRWWKQRAAADDRRRPRPGGLSTARIVATALEVLHEGGLDALTLRAVAGRLGIGSNASLYRHIASRDELIVLIIDHLMGGVRLDRTGLGWRADAEALMRQVHQVILEQPLPTSVTRSRAVFGPNMLRITDATLGVFLDAGLAAEPAAFAAMTLVEFTAGVTTIHRTRAGRRSTTDERAEFDEVVDGLPAGEFRALRAAGREYMTASGEDVFARGLALVLDGIAAQLPGGVTAQGRRL